MFYICCVLHIAAVAAAVGLEKIDDVVRIYVKHVCFVALQHIKCFLVQAFYVVEFQVHYLMVIHS